MDNQTLVAKSDKVVTGKKFRSSSSDESINFIETVKTNEVASQPPGYNQFSTKNETPSPSTSGLNLKHRTLKVALITKIMLCYQP